jgi:hypothetical protein
VLAGGGEKPAPEDAPGQGRNLLRVWLALTQRGLYAHPLSQILDCPETALDLAARVGAEPFSVFRAGRSVPPARSHRRRA